MIDPSQMTFQGGKQALRLVAQEADEGSYWGGRPRVPTGWSWPRRANGQPLSFLGQLNLDRAQAALPMDHLPDNGTLLFFYDTQDQPWGFDPADADGFRVEYYPSITPLYAVDNAEDTEIFDQVFLGFEVIETYYEGLPGIVGVEQPDDDTLEEVHDFISERNFPDMAHHQMGGYPDPIQNADMESECELASHRVNVGNAQGYASAEGQRLLNAGGADAWRLVLQVDTDENGPGWMWGDSGMLYFWVKQDAGRAGHFSNAWVVLQCC